MFIKTERRIISGGIHANKEEMYRAIAKFVEQLDSLELEPREEIKYTDETKLTISLRRNDGKSDSEGKRFYVDFGIVEQKRLDAREQNETPNT